MLTCFRSSTYGHLLHFRRPPTAHLLQRSEGEVTLLAYTFKMKFTEGGMKEFNRRVQALPQELIDEIRDLAFTTRGGTFNMQASTYTSKAPPRLSVSKATRDHFAKSYYGNSLFIFTDDRDLGKWLDSIDEAHLGMIRTVRVAKGRWVYDFKTTHDIRKIRKQMMRHAAYWRRQVESIEPILLESAI